MEWSRALAGLRRRLSRRLWRALTQVSAEEWAELQEVGPAGPGPALVDGSVTRLASIGPAPLSSLYAARNALFGTFRHRVEVIEPLPLPAGAYNQRRRQVGAYRLLKSLETYAGPDTFRVIGLINADLYIPGAGYIFGTGLRGSRAIVIGLQRLLPAHLDGPDRTELLTRRVATLVISQVSAGLGLGPCPTAGCARAPIAALPDLDGKAPALCPACAARVAAWLREEG